MNNLTSNIGHIIMAAIITAAVTVLAITNRITGSEALIVITAAGGVSLGGSVASSSGGVLGLGSAIASTSRGTSTSVPTVTTVTTELAPSTPTSTVTATAPASGGAL